MERDAISFETAFGDGKSGFEACVIDAGMRTHMLCIYNYMALGLAVTGLAALAIYGISVTSEVEAAATMVRSGAEYPVRFTADSYLTPLGYLACFGPMKWPIILAPLGLIIGLSFGIDWVRPLTAQVVFWVYAALLGLSLGSVFMVYAHTSVARTFFVAAAAFAALSALGYATKRNVTAMGAFLIMGLCGALIAGAINFFLASSALQWITTIVGVLVFAGLTAWDTQRLKNDYIYEAQDGDVAARAAILGALSLYLDFGNLFALMLEWPGQRDD